MSHGSSTDESDIVVSPKLEMRPQFYGGRSSVWKYYKKVIDEKREGRVCIVPVPKPSGEGTKPCLERRGKKYSLELWVNLKMHTKST